MMTSLMASLMASLIASLMGYEHALDGTPREETQQPPASMHVLTPAPSPSPPSRPDILGASCAPSRYTTELSRRSSVCAHPDTPAKTFSFSECS